MKLKRGKKIYATFADTLQTATVLCRGKGKVIVQDKWKSQDGKGIKSMGGRHEHKTCYK